MTFLNSKCRLLLLGLTLVALQPHSVLAGAWTLPRGEFWSKITFMTLSTREEYVGVGGAGRQPDPGIIYSAGDRARYREEGAYDSRAVFLDSAIFVDF